MMETSNETHIRQLLENWAKAARAKDMGGVLARHADDDLVDKLHLLLYPLTLGSGKRLLPNGIRATFASRSATPYPSGVVGLGYVRQHG
jgi:dihydrofolate reductase